MPSYRVHLKSQPGPMAQYEGYVDVTVGRREDAADRARERLRQTSFSDRSASCWLVTKIEERS